MYDASIESDVPGIPANHTVVTRMGHSVGREIS